MSRLLFFLFAILPLFPTGCALLPDPPVHYNADQELLPIKKVKRSGDFALYYGTNKKPEIPVRVQAGQSVGFQIAPAGQTQAIAGPFKLNLPSETRDASWKRLNYRDD